jgi:hypothetical protein
MNPEPINTDLEKCVPRPAGALDKPVFIGSGFGPAGRPGMTKIVSRQFLRSGPIRNAGLLRVSCPRLEGR